MLLRSNGKYHSIRKPADSARVNKQRTISTGRSSTKKTSYEHHNCIKQKQRLHRKSLWHSSTLNHVKLMNACTLQCRHEHPCCNPFCQVPSRLFEILNSQKSVPRSLKFSIQDIEEKSHQKVASLPSKSQPRLALTFKVDLPHHVLTFKVDLEAILKYYMMAHTTR